MIIYFVWESKTLLYIENPKLHPHMYLKDNFWFLNQLSWKFCLLKNPSVLTSQKLPLQLSLTIFYWPPWWCHLPSLQSCPCWCKPHNILDLDIPAPIPPLLSGSAWNHIAWPVDSHHLHGNSAGSPPGIQRTTCCQWSWTGFCGSTGGWGWWGQKICGGMVTRERC